MDEKTCDKVWLLWQSCSTLLSLGTRPASWKGPSHLQKRFFKVVVSLCPLQRCLCLFSSFELYNCTHELTWELGDLCKVPASVLLWSLQIWWQKIKPFNCEDRPESLLNSVFKTLFLNKAAASFSLSFLNLRSGLLNVLLAHLQTGMQEFLPVLLAYQPVVITVQSPSSAVLHCPATWFTSVTGACDG